MAQLNSYIKKKIHWCILCGVNHWERVQEYFYIKLQKLRFWLWVFKNFWQKKLVYKRSKDFKILSFFNFDCNYAIIIKISHV